MPSLSTPIGELQAAYDVVVIGSGYGGAIAAYRMAQRSHRLSAHGHAGFSVCLLERGIEKRPGEYPTSFGGAMREIQLDTRFGHLGSRTGLFDIRTNPDVSVLVGCGLGGTSLINAAVMLEPHPSVFEKKEWPEPLNARAHPDALKNEFRTVRRQLQVSEVPKNFSMDKVTWLEDAAKRAQTEARRVPLAVSFSTKVTN